MSTSAAIICRSPESARRIAHTLRLGTQVHLALEGRFRFGPGAQVTAVHEVKGLEFDYVVVPDATAAVYPDTPESRRALYVASTRAVRRLLLAGAGAQSPLVRPAAAGATG